MNCVSKQCVRRLLLGGLCATLLWQAGVERASADAAEAAEYVVVKDPSNAKLSGAVIAGTLLGQVLAYASTYLIIARFEGDNAAYWGALASAPLRALLPATGASLAGLSIGAEGHVAKTYGVNALTSLLADGFLYGGLALIEANFYDRGSSSRARFITGASLMGMWGVGQLVSLSMTARTYITTHKQKQLAKSERRLSLLPALDPESRHLGLQLVGTF